MNTFSYNNRKKAKKHIGYPCLFFDTVTSISDGILRSVVDDELPFVYYEAPHKYKYVMPIDTTALYKVFDLSMSMDLKQIIAAAIYLNYREEVCL